MKQANLNLVRGYVLLAGDLCRLAWWIYVVVILITNYTKLGQVRHEELRKPI